MTAGHLRPEELIRATARAQHGVISHLQARAAGLSDEAVWRRAKRGYLDRILPQVYSIGGTSLTWRSRLKAATLWTGPGSAASHRSAARLHGFPGFASAPIEIATTLWKNCSEVETSDGMPLVVHRVDNHLLPEIENLDEIPVTSVRRTLIDLAGRKDYRAETALDAARREGFVTLGQMWLLLEHEWMRGRRGVRIMRDMLAARTEGDAPTQSQLEVMMLRLLREAGYPPPMTQFPIELSDGAIHVDFAYPDQRLVIETDGYAWHMDRASFENDRRRDTELGALGWRVLRFTWARVTFERPAVLRILDDVHHQLFTECT